MEREARRCQNCKSGFTIESADFDFYKKMSVPAPTWCPECRRMRRFAFTNLWNLYKRPCRKCGKNVISIYSPDKPFTTYCQPCWWADDWDGTEYAMEYDPTRPFLEQVRELNLKTPRMTLEAAYLTLTNSDYANGLGHCKNCYLIFWADYCENVFYSHINTPSVSSGMEAHTRISFHCVLYNGRYATTVSQKPSLCLVVRLSPRQ